MYAFSTYIHARWVWLYMVHNMIVYKNMCIYICTVYVQYMYGSVYGSGILRVYGICVEDCPTWTSPETLNPRHVKSATAATSRRI